MYPNSVALTSIARLNKGNSSEISINGQLSEPIDLTQGTGQGDPASTMKFSVLHAFWIALIQHVIKSTRNKLHQLMIPMEKLVNPSITHINRENIPKSLPPMAFADD